MITVSSIPWMHLEFWSTSSDTWAISPEKP